MSKFSFKKEVGFSEVLAFLALIISALAFWEGYKANDGYIVKGSRSAIVANINNSCTLLVSLPLEFHNSGNRAVAMERYLPTSIDEVLFVKDNVLDVERAIDYKFYIVPNIYDNIAELYDSAMEIGQYDLQEYALLDHLILPNETLKSTVVIISELVKHQVQLADRILIAIDSSFSNGQNLEIRSSVSIEVPEHIRKQCDS